MSEKTIQQISINQSINSYSLIKLPLFEDTKYKNYSYQWISQKQQGQSIALSDNYIFNRFQPNKITKNPQYQCTPLDYQNVIIGKILAQTDKGLQIVRQYKYGPVTAETEVLKQVNNDLKLQAKIVINKNSLMDVGISLYTSNQLLRNNEDKVYIILEAEAHKFKFQLNLDKSIRLPSNNSVFKFYQKQQHSLGISMYHQHSQFMQKLKQIKILSHFGFYIKLYFSNRIARDAFLFTIMTKFQQLQKEKQGIGRMSEIKIIVTESNIMRNQTCQLPIQSMKKSKNQQIDDQIFKLLYEASERGDQLSLDMADAQCLFASCKKVDLQSSKILKSSDTYSLQKRSQLLNQKNTNRPESQKSYQFACFNSDKIILDVKNMNNLKIQKIDEEYIKNFKPNNEQKEVDQNFLRSTISKLTNQIQSLQKQNKKLAQQNKKLRDENMRLRFKQIKNNSSIFLNKHLMISKNASKQVIRFPSEFSISTSPIKQTVKCQSPNFEFPTQQMEINKKKQQRYFTGNIRKIVTNQSSSHLITPMSPLTPNTPINLQLPHRSQKNISEFQAIGNRAYNDFIKQETEQQFRKNNLLKLQFKQSKAKQKTGIPKTTSTHRKSHGAKSPKQNITGLSPKAQNQKLPTPNFSQIINPQLTAKQRFTGTNSIHYTSTNNFT